MLNDDEFGSKKQKNYLGADPEGRDACCLPLHS
jgi:hypothetical protein